MRVRLLTVSNKQPAWVVAGSAEYGKRLPREWRFEVVEIRPEPRSGGGGKERLLAAEAARLQRALGPRERLVALDERGEPWTTQELAARLARWQRDGGDVAFVAGGADGLAVDLLAAAAHRVSLSALTLPHGLVRVLVAEQLYRAASLLDGHPYHRA